MDSDTMRFLDKCCPLAKRERRRIMMRFVRKLCFLSLSASLTLAQSTTDTRPASGTVEDQIKVLRQALAEQQQQIAQQRQEIGRQHEEITQQSREIQTL